METFFVKDILFFDCFFSFSKLYRCPNYFLARKKKVQKRNKIKHKKTIKFLWLCFDCETFIQFSDFKLLLSSFLHFFTIFFFSFHFWLFFFLLFSDLVFTVNRMVICFLLVSLSLTLSLPLPLFLLYFLFFSQSFFLSSRNQKLCWRFSGPCAPETKPWITSFCAKRSEWEWHCLGLRSQRMKKERKKRKEKRRRREEEKGKDES